MLLLLALLAFIVGFSLHRGTNCSVVAARQLARRRDPTRLTSFIVGAAAAMAIAIPLVWASAGGLKAAMSFGLGWPPVVGGAFYGLGALVNGACALGTVVRISEGRLGFLAAIPGIGIGAYLATRLGFAGYRAEPTAALMATPGAIQTAAVVSAGIIVIAGLVVTTMRVCRAGYRPKTLLTASRWRPMMGMLVTGVAGGLAFIIAESWAWPAVVRRLAQVAAGAPPEFPLVMLIGPAALFAGGFAAGWLSGRLCWRLSGWRQVIQSLTGGAIMGASAFLIPGGNDVMLLHALPALALSGIAAYAAMFAVLVPVLALLPRLRTIPRP